MWRIIADDWQFKLLALVLAVLVWLYTNSVVTKTAEISAEFVVNVPRNVDVQVSPESRKVMLTVLGPTGVIDELGRWERVRVVYDVKDVEKLKDARRTSVTFDPKMVQNLPSQVQVLYFDPDKFDLTVRALATMELTVTPPRTVGTPAPGYEVAKSEIRGRSTVTVTGPAEALRRIKERRNTVDAEPVDVSNRTEPVVDRFRRIQTDVRLDNTTVEHIQCDDRVEVYVDIRRADVPDVVKGVKIAVLASPESALDVEITSPNPVDISIIGPPDLVKSVTPDRLYAFIDVRARKPDNELPFFENLVVQGLPDGVKLQKEVVVTARFKAKKTTVPEAKTQ
jgi:YbbR domain-containing protein